MNGQANEVNGKVHCVISSIQTEISKLQKLKFNAFLLEHDGKTLLKVLKREEIENYCLSK